MATTVMQVRVDEELKNQAAAVYEDLGLDLPTAIRMFLKRSVLVNGVPFDMTLPRQSDAGTLALQALRGLSDSARQNGIADLSLDEINAEIAAARAERRQ